MSLFFRYHVKDVKGMDRDGSIEASDEMDAARKLQEQGLVVISVEMIEGRGVVIKPAEEKQHGTTKKCPFCAEEIQYNAIKCKHCGEMLASKRFECTISKVSSLILKQGAVNIGLQYTWLQGSDEFDKMEIEAKDMETVMAKLNSKNIVIEGIAEISADGQRGEVYNTCVNCHKLKSIDATICPYCGKESSFMGAYITGGAILAGATYYLLNLNQPYGDRFLGSLLWGVIGAVGGVISGVSSKSKIKKGAVGRARNESRFDKFADKILPAGEIRKKFSMVFIGTGILLLALSLFIYWQSDPTTRGGFVAGVLLFIPGGLLFIFGVYVKRLDGNKHY